MRFFDTHTHFTDSRFDEDREQLITGMTNSGDEYAFVDVACNTEDAKLTLELAEKHPNIYAVIGMHPHEAASVTEAHMEKIYELLMHKKAVALGEIGLDYHYDFAPRKTQKKWFARQMDLAKELNLPVVLHIREAFGDCMETLRKQKGEIKGVMHCFSGSYEIADECVRRGMYIAFGGAVTFNNAVNLKDAAKRLPLEKILLETDCPYMTPVPFRGKRNDPTKLVYIAGEIARLKNISAEKVCEATFSNACEAFEINRQTKC